LREREAAHSSRDEEQKDSENRTAARLLRGRYAACALRHFFSPSEAQLSQGTDNGAGGGDRRGVHATVQIE
jgi:hypothetical protein